MPDTTEIQWRNIRKVVQQAERSICGMCGYTGSQIDDVGQCPRCHWDELNQIGDTSVRSALNAMLTQFGMDEDEWNKPTFDQARAALATTTASMPTPSTARAVVQQLVTALSEYGARRGIGRAKNASQVAIVSKQASGVAIMLH